MGLAKFEPPHITARRTDEKVDEILNYLYKLVEGLNWTVNTIESNLSNNAAESLKTTLSQSLAHNTLVPQYVGSNIEDFARGCGIGITPFRAASSHGIVFVTETRTTIYTFADNGKIQMTTKLNQASSFDAWKSITLS